MYDENELFYSCKIVLKKRALKLLTHFSPVSHFYTLWKRQKTKVFWRFQGVQKCDTRLKWVQPKLFLAIENLFQFQGFQASAFEFT